MRPTHKSKRPSSIRNISSRDLVREIRSAGILGNTLDATDGYGLSSETSWGNPKTNKAMIDKIKAGGFNTLRVPTTWKSTLACAKLHH